MATIFLFVGVNPDLRYYIKVCFVGWEARPFDTSGKIPEVINKALVDTMKPIEAKVDLVNNPV